MSRVHFKRLALCIVAAMMFPLLLLTAYAQSVDGEGDDSNSRVQAFTGSVATGAADNYILSDLQQGQVLSVYLDARSGNLDPLLMLFPGDIDLRETVTAAQEQLGIRVSAGEDPFVASYQVMSEYFLTFDDDSGDGYNAMFSFEVPEDGDYSLVVLSTLAKSTSGAYRLLIGINAPQVETGIAATTGDEIATFDSAFSARNIAVQEVTGELTEETTFRLQPLNQIRAGETLYVYVEATSGDLKPVLTLADFGGKPLRNANTTDTTTSAALEYTFLDDEDNYQIQVSACCENALTTGEYRLLVGVNEPTVLEGQGEPQGRELVKSPIPVAIGIQVDQITNVDQKSENYSIVGTIRMEWQDDRRSFSPDSCQCDLKNNVGAGFSSFVSDETIEWPEYVIFNQQGRRDTQTQGVVTNPEGRSIYIERFTVTLQAPDFDFRAFPFDVQQFFVRIDSVFPVDFFTYHDLEGFSQFGEQLGEEEWIVTDAGTTLETYDNSSRMSFGFKAYRHINFYFFRIFVPLALILLVSWFTFFLKDYGKRVDVATAMLLVFVAFNFTISGELPRLGYLTFLDGVIIGAFILTGLMVAVNVYFKRLEISGKGDQAKRLDNILVWLYPAFCVGGLIFLYFEFLR